MAVPNGMSVATLQMEGEIQFSRRVLMCVCVCVIWFKLWEIGRTDVTFLHGVCFKELKANESPTLGSLLYVWCIRYRILV